MKKRFAHKYEELIVREHENAKLGEKLYVTLKEGNGGKDGRRHARKTCLCPYPRKREMFYFLSPARVDLYVLAWM